MILLFITGLLITGACEKLEDPKLANEQSLEAFENDAELKAAGIGFAIVVEPEGPEYDTENLLNAFQEIAERPGPGLIQLTQGTYYLDQIFIQDFEGWFRGAGKTKTIIHPIPGGINMNVNVPPDEMEPYYFNFSGGDIRISDMTFDINLDEPMIPRDGYLGDGVTFIAAVIRIVGSSPENYTANSLISDVTFIGRYVDLIDFTPYNIDNSILIGGGFGMLPLGGKQRVQSCDFLCMETGINSLGASHSTLVFGGAPSLGNTMQNMNCGIFALGSEASNFRISFNRMEEMHATGGIKINQTDIPSFVGDLDPGGSKYLIQENTIDMASDPYPNAIVLLDYLVLSDPEKASEFKLIGNQVSLGAPGQWVILAYGSQDVDIIRNQASGEAELGMGLLGPIHGFQFLNNDFGSFNSTIADIYLNPNSYENLVATGLHTTVWDLGTDNSFKGKVELVSPALKSAETWLEKKQLRRQ